MAKKTVKVSLSEHELGREERALVFVATDGTSKLGDLHVSQGGFRWYPKNSKGSHHHVSWKRFSQLMEDVPKTK
ncbi:MULTISPECIES: hypothetical protein [Rhodopseudomonas]|uniref:hypothetical protein n=1 Tax=Rhodopseudomonas TaxID=1073 RepID=UPI00128D605F|nr:MULTISPECIES: hypothetical protein [Rhodopseudomonas]MDF3809225.1 hypothetical protein [Rhodopseudomonas sp. BAL398]WOK19091.1 hypothetical protein RBJ75_06105 [Rhodopseudomonas sp. BAL398]